MSAMNAKTGIILLVVAVVCVAAISVTYINKQQTAYDMLEMEILTKKVVDNNLTFSIGFQEYDQSAQVYLNVTVDRLAIKDRIEATHEMVFNETYTTTIEAPVDVLKFENITAVKTDWIYRVHIDCIIPTHSEERETEFYVFSE